MDQICQSCHMPMIGAVGEVLTSCPMCGAPVEGAEAPVERTVVGPVPTADEITSGGDRQEASQEPHEAATQTEPPRAAPETPITALEAPGAGASASLEENEASETSATTEEPAQEEASVAEAAPEANAASETGTGAVASTSPPSEGSAAVEATSQVAVAKAAEASPWSESDELAPESTDTTESPLSIERAAEANTATEAQAAESEQMTNDSPGDSTSVTNIKDIEASFEANRSTPTQESMPASPSQPAPTSPSLGQLAQASQAQTQQQVAKNLRPASMKAPPQGAPSYHQTSTTGQFPAALPGTSSFDPSEQFKVSPVQGLPSSTGQFPVHAIQQQAIQQQRYQQQPMLPSSTGQFPVHAIQQQAYPQSPSSTGQFPAQMGPGATGQFPVQNLQGYQQPMLPTPTGQFPAHQMPSGQYQATSGQYQATSGPHQAPQAAAAPSNPGPSSTLIAAELAELLDLKPPSPPWFALTLVMVLFAGAAGTGAAYLTQKFLQGPCQTMRPKITFDQAGNQKKAGQDWQCRADGGWLRKGVWQKGLREGQWQRWYANGFTRAEGNYDKGQREGVHRTWHPNGTLKSQNKWAKGLQQGEATIAYDNGNTKELVTFLNGQRQGKSTSYYESGKLKASGKYHQDQRCGQWLYWDDAGKQTRRTRYNACGTTRSTPLLLNAELAAKELSGRWRKSSKGKTLTVTGTIQNNSKETISSIRWNKELILSLNDGRTLHRKDTANASLGESLDPNDTTKIQWATLGSGILHLDKDTASAVKRAVLRISAKVTTSQGVVVSFVFYQARLPLPDTKKSFDLTSQPAAKLDAKALKAQAQTKSSPKPRKRTPSLPSPPPPPPLPR